MLALTREINNMKKEVYLILLIAGMIFQSFSVKQTKKEISQSEAIRLAEEFIIENGYTFEKPNESKMKFEMFDREINKVIKERHNTLQKKAFCISKDKEWNIGFLSTNVKLKKMTIEQKKGDLDGRAVKVSLDGKKISIAHKDPLFSFFEKL